MRMSAAIASGTRQASSGGATRLLAKAGVVTSTILLVLFAVFPLYWMIVTALSKLGSSRGAGQPLWPTMVTFDNFIYVFTQVPLALWLFNSAFVAITVATAAPFVG